MTNESFIKVNNKLVLVNGHPITINGSSSNLQENKAVTITSNGTATITPDAGYDGLSSVNVTVDVASGGGGGAGFKVTFPATATGWAEVDTNDSYIYLADGTIKYVKDYSTIGGKTIENVAAIQIKSMVESFVLRMTLSAGVIAQFAYEKLYITSAPNTTQTPYSSGRGMIWWPVADTVISAIEMYDTD